MTLGEIIAEVNETKPNTYDDGLFIKWLSQQDGRVFNDVIMTHEHALVEDEDGNSYDPFGGMQLNFIVIQTIV